jgi:hypothetical protein
VLLLSIRIWGRPHTIQMFLGYGKRNGKRMNKSNGKIIMKKSRKVINVLKE